MRRERWLAMGTVAVAAQAACRCVVPRVVKPNFERRVGTLEKDRNMAEWSALEPGLATHQIFISICVLGLLSGRA
jgi:hypothetical protein